MFLSNELNCFNYKCDEKRIAFFVQHCIAYMAHHLSVRSISASALSVTHQKIAAS